MNKSLILATILGVAFTSCVNESDSLGFQNHNEDLISFSTPVVGTSSRASLSELGYEPGRMNSLTYNQSQNFRVYGIYTQDSKNLNPVTYIDNQLVSIDDNKKDWVTETNYVWPKKGKLSFYAYSPAGAFMNQNENQNAKVAVNGDYLEIQNFVVPSAIEKQFDLMYTTSQEKNCSGPHERVQLPFKHALSCVNVTLSVVSESLETTENSNAFLKSITLKGINNTGNWKKEKWQDQNGNASYELFTEGKDKFPLTKGTTWNKEKNPKKELLLLPQTLNKNAVLEIVWYLIGDDKQRIENTTTVNLKNKYASENWDKGYIYTYNLTLQLDKVEVDVTYDRNEWSNVEKNK